MSNNVKRIHPFTGEEYILDASVTTDVDDGLIYLVEHEGERMYVLVYTGEGWTVQKSNNTEYIYYMDAIEDDTLSTRSENTSKFKDNSFTLDKVYTPYGYEAPEVLYFTDTVVDVIELVGVGYTGSYNRQAYSIPDCNHLYTNGTLEEHRHIPQRMQNGGAVDATLIGMDDYDSDKLPTLVEISSSGYFPHDYRLYTKADINDEELEITELTMITDTQESE